MIRFLRSGEGVTFLVFLIIILVMRLPIFWVDQNLASLPANLSWLRIDLIRQWPVLDYLLTSFIILIQGFWLNVIYESHTVLGKRTHLIFFFYGFLFSLFPTHLSLSSIHILSFGILYFINKIYKKSDLKSIQGILFELGFVIGLLGLIQGGYLYLLLLVFAALQAFHSFQFKQWITPILGLLAPLYLFFASAYLFDFPVIQARDNLMAEASFKSWSTAVTHDTDTLLNYAMVILVSTIPVFNFIRIIQGSKVRVSKLYQWSFGMLIWCFAIGFANTSDLLISFLGTTAVLSLIFSIQLISYKKEKVATGFILALFGIWIVNLMTFSI